MTVIYSSPDEVPALDGDLPPAPAAAFPAGDLPAPESAAAAREADDGALAPSAPPPAETPVTGPPRPTAESGPAAAAARASSGAGADAQLAYLDPAITRLRAAAVSEGAAASVFAVAGSVESIGSPRTPHHHKRHTFTSPPAVSLIDYGALSSGNVVTGPLSAVDAGDHSPEARAKRKTLRRRNTFNFASQLSRDEDEEQASKKQEAFARRLTKKAKKKKPGDDEVAIGTKIGEDHVNYVMMYNMLTGIRIGVSRCQAKPQRALGPSDFKAAHKLAFDIMGSELTPSAKYDFKFKDYAPWVFRHLRECFRIDAADYLVSLTSKYILSELGSPGKSGSFFYYSSDYRFIIKTIHHSEHKFFRAILPSYYEHVRANPNTLISRFFGLHRVKLPHGRKVHFVVMGNVFPPNRDIHETYDLKGSSVGRAVGEEEIKTNPRCVMKDLDWLERSRRLEFGPAKRRIFIAQMEKDVALLSSLNIMDYSLLIGIHYLERGNKENIRDTTLSVFDPGQKQQHDAGGVDGADGVGHAGGDGGGGAHAAGGGGGVGHGAGGGAAASGVEGKLGPGLGKRGSKVSAMRRVLVESDPVSLGPSKSKLPDDAEAFTERKHCVFYQDDGGFLATDDTDRAGNVLYYIGIIDILTPYSFVKKVEHYWKAMSVDKLQISAVKPKWYGERFLDFMLKKALRS